MQSQRVLLFDIESTDLEASFGYCICIGYKWLGESRTHVMSIYDYPIVTDPLKEPDALLMKAFYKLITDKADIIVSYYGKQFDIRFLNTRMLLAGLPPMPPFGQHHIDLYYTAKFNLKLHSNRLQAVSETLGCPVSKTPVRADIWRKAQRGHRQSVDYVVSHCKRDIEILEWVYLKLRGFIRQHPLVAKMEDCKNCGTNHFQFRGYNVTSKGVKQRRRQCQGCGHWSVVEIEQ